jgi:heme/copper-type cytochrome/quinol oxidase subunit 1
MFTMVRRFIKTGLAFLGIGLLLGGYLLIRRELEGVFPDRYLVSAHVHAVGVGFVMFMILGVALWLFPKPTKEDTRYQPARIELAYWFLVTATGVRFLAEIARASDNATWLRVLVLAAGLGQITGLAVYFFTMWTRIRPVGSHLREARGERF